MEEREGMKVVREMRRWRRGLVVRAQGLQARLRAKLACESGQGTTEYAILVGVLTKLDSVLAKKYEFRGLACSR